jgi:hypothetical protein
VSIVSTNPIYSFTVFGDRSLVANFTAIPPNQYTVTVSPNPLAGGTVLGGGLFNSGDPVTVTATPSPGYTFTNWTEGVNVVSLNASYAFNIAGNRILVANFAVVVPPPQPVDLKSAVRFGGLGGNAGITNQGIFTQINNGNIATTAASTLVTGFHDATAPPFNVFTETPLNVGAVADTIYTATAPLGSVPGVVAAQALLDAQAAYIYLAGLPPGGDPNGGELGGLTLAPGTYTSAGGTFKITSVDLTLDGQNNPNARFVFQMSSSLTVGAAGPLGARSIILIRGAQAKNVYWQVGSAATINGAGGGTMVGTIIAMQGVTFSTAGNVTLTRLEGRALSLIASVTMVNTIINVPLP